MNKNQDAMPNLNMTPIYGGTVGELIAALQSMPHNAPVLPIYDGGHDIDFQWVWLSKHGCVILSEAGEPVGGDCHRPIGAPSSKEDRFWSAPDHSDKLKENLPVEIKDLALALRSVRASNDASQEDMAFSALVPTWLYRSWERGYAIPTDDAIARIEAFAKVKLPSLSAALTASQNEKEQTEIKEINRGIELLRLCQDLQSEKDGIARPEVGEFDKTKTLDQFARDINMSATYMISLHQYIPMMHEIADLGRQLEKQGKLNVQASENYVLAVIQYLKNQITAK